MTATPGTITAGELRAAHFGPLVIVGKTGRKIHKGRISLSGDIWVCCDYYCEDAAKLPSPDHREIEYSRLCRHCFRELLKDTRP